MHELAPHDRPREKLERGGVAVLGDNELLAVVLGHGSHGRGALALANDLLAAGSCSAYPASARRRPAACRPPSSSAAARCSSGARPARDSSCLAMRRRIYCPSTAAIRWNALASSCWT